MEFNLRMRGLPAGWIHEFWEIEKTFALKECIKINIHGFFVAAPVTELAF